MIIWNNYVSLRMAGRCRTHLFKRFISEMTTFIKKRRCGQVAEWFRPRRTGKRTLQMRGALWFVGTPRTKIRVGSEVVKRIRL